MPGKRKTEDRPKKPVQVKKPAQVVYILIAEYWPEGRGTYKDPIKEVVAAGNDPMLLGEEAKKYLGFAPVGHERPQEWVSGSFRIICKEMLLK